MKVLKINIFILKKYLRTNNKNRNVGIIYQLKDVHI